MDAHERSTAIRSYSTKLYPQSLRACLLSISLDNYTINIFIYISCKFACSQLLPSLKEAIWHALLLIFFNDNEVRFARANHISTELPKSFEGACFIAFLVEGSTAETSLNSFSLPCRF